MKTNRVLPMRLPADLIRSGSGLFRLQKVVTNVVRQAEERSKNPRIDASSSHRTVFQDPIKRAFTPNRGLILVNTYANTGIADFGLDLHENLARRGFHPRLVSTPISWIDFLRYFLLTLTLNAQIIFNIGLTSWGPSP